MKKTELQKIRERHARRVLWKQNKEDIMEFLEACALCFFLYIFGIAVLCL